MSFRFEISTVQKLEYRKRFSPLVGRGSRQTRFGLACPKISRLPRLLFRQEVPWLEIISRILIGWRHCHVTFSTFNVERYAECNKQIGRDIEMTSEKDFQVLLFDEFLIIFLVSLFWRISPYSVILQLPCCWTCHISRNCNKGHTGNNAIMRVRLETQVGRNTLS